MAEDMPKGEAIVTIFQTSIQDSRNQITIKDLD